MTDTTITLDALDPTATALAATIKAAVNGEGKYSRYVKAHDVTLDTVADHARALAVFTYPNEKPVQKVEDGKRTKFGNAVQKAGLGLRTALKDEDDPSEDDTTDYLAKVIAAVDNGVTHNLDAASILAAVKAHVDSLLS